MSENINLKQLEQKAWRSIFQDGLYDIFLGYLILHMGNCVYAGKGRISSRLPSRPLIWAFISWRRYCFTWANASSPTRAPAGSSLAPSGRGKLAWLTIVYFVVLLAALVLTLLALDNGVNFLSEKVKAVLSVSWLSIFLLLFFGVPAFLLQYNRLYLIAVMFALARAAVETVQSPMEYRPGYFRLCRPGTGGAGHGHHGIGAFYQNLSGG